MSELKAEQWLDYAGEPRPCYPKSEADKVIAELKKEKEYTLEHTTEVINAQEREIRHYKYKRCLDKAKWCKLWYDNEKYEWQLKDVHHLFRMFLFDKWQKRWLKIAERFKAVK